ncbi:unnamed protein product [Scytosiphon promiscuus]
MQSPVLSAKCVCSHPVCVSKDPSGQRHGDFARCFHTYARSVFTLNLSDVPRVGQYLRKERPDALVYVMALFPRADREDETSPRPWPVIDQVNASMLSMLNREFGEDKVVFIDCTARFLAEDESGNPVLNGEFILPDNLHLTREGLQAWAECVEGDLHANLSEGAG